MPHPLEKQIGYTLLASGGALLVAALFYQAVSNYKPSKLQDDRVKVENANPIYNWFLRDEQQHWSLIIEALGDNEWHDSGIHCEEGEHYQFAPHGEFHPMVVDVCGSLFEIKQPPPSGRYLEAYTVTGRYFSGTPQRPIVLYNHGQTIKLKSVNNQTVSIFLQTNGAIDKIKDIVRQKNIDNNFGRPPEITGTDFQKVSMPSYWQLQERLLGSYYMAIPAGRWVNTGINITPCESRVESE